MHSIPTEIKEMIFMYLDVKSITSLHLVSKEIKNICNSQRFWTFLLKRDYSKEAEDPKNEYSECFVDNCTSAFVDKLSEIKDRLIQQDIRYIFDNAESEIHAPIRQYSQKMCNNAEYIQQVRRVAKLILKIDNFGDIYTDPLSRLIEAIIYGEMYNEIEKYMMSILSLLLHQSPSQKSIFKKVIKCCLFEFDKPLRFNKMVENTLLSSTSDIPQLWSVFLRKMLSSTPDMVVIWYKLHVKNHNKSAEIVLEYIQMRPNYIDMFLLMMENSPKKRKKYITKLLSVHGDDMFLQIRI
jgi:hypothetical protein